MPKPISLLPIWVIFFSCIFRAPARDNAYDTSCGGVAVSDAASCFRLEVKEVVILTLNIQDSNQADISYYYKTTDGCSRDKTGAVVSGTSCNVPQPHASKIAALTATSVVFSGSCPGRASLDATGHVTPLGTFPDGVCKIQATASPVYGSGSVSLEAEINFSNPVPPTLSSGTPADLATGIAPCGGNPCSAKMILVFSKTMSTALSQTLTTEIYNGSAFVAVGSAGSVFAWSTTTVSNDTLTITPPWYRFPENAQIRFTLDAAGLTDPQGRPIAANVQRTFTTTTAKENLAIADTGQSICYADPVTFTCGSNPTYVRQDADMAGTPNARNFTGPTQHGTFTADYTVTDNVSGLVWQACILGMGMPVCSAGTSVSVDWNNAVNQCGTLNTQNSGSGYAGRTNWRLPTTAELESLMNFSNGASPFTDSAFATAESGETLWSGTVNASNAAQAYQIFHSSPSIAPAAKTGLARIRCVSSAAALTPLVYTSAGDGTIITNATRKLRWQRCSSGTYTEFVTGCSGGTANALLTWSGALQYCANLTLGGYSWRLPSLAELRSLFDYSRASPGALIDTTAFPGTIASVYWTSTTLQSSASNAYRVSFDQGVHSVAAKNVAGNGYTRCVADYP